MPGGGSIRRRAVGDAVHRRARREDRRRLAVRHGGVGAGRRVRARRRVHRRLLRRYLPRCNCSRRAVAPTARGPPLEPVGDQPPLRAELRDRRADQVVLLAAARRGERVLGGRDASGGKRGRRSGRHETFIQLTRCAVIGVGTAVPSGPTVCTIAAGWYAPSAVYAGRAYAAGRRRAAGGPPGRRLPSGIGRAAAAAGAGWRGRGWRQYAPPVCRRCGGASAGRTCRSGTCGDGGEGGRGTGGGRWRGGAGGDAGGSGVRRAWEGTGAAERTAWPEQARSRVRRRVFGRLWAPAPAQTPRCRNCSRRSRPPPARRGEGSGSGARVSRRRRRRPPATPPVDVAFRSRRLVGDPSAAGCRPPARRLRSRLVDGGEAAARLAARTHA